MLEVGKWRLDIISGGTFLIDGGTMFGVVPKALWARRQKPDDVNRIPSATNCIVARNGQHTVIVDTGAGGKASEKDRQRLSLPPGEPLVEGLIGLGLAPDDVDLVVLSHLHFDHAGGSTRLDESGRVVPSFPKARHIVQRGEWDIAASDVPELKGSYPGEHFLPLAKAGLVDYISGDVEVAPGIRVEVTGGHTRYHQAVFFESDGQTAVYLGDICPTSDHLKTLWCMSYDVELLDTRRAKPRLLARAAAENWWVIFDHDPTVAAARIGYDDKGEFTIVDPQPAP